MFLILKSYFLLMSCYIHFVVLTYAQSVTKISLCVTTIFHNFSNSDVIMTEV